MTRPWTTDAAVRRRAARHALETVPRAVQMLLAEIQDRGISKRQAAHELGYTPDIVTRWTTGQGRLSYSSLIDVLTWIEQGPRPTTPTPTETP